MHGPYKNAVHPTTSSEGERTQFIDLQTIQCLNWYNTETSEKMLSFSMWSRVDTNKFTDVSEVPTATTFYSHNRGSKLLRNVPPTVLSATTRKKILVMAHVIQTSNLTWDVSASFTNAVTIVSTNSKSWFSKMYNLNETKFQCVLSKGTSEIKLIKWFFNTVTKRNSAPTLRQIRLHFMKGKECS
jgi:hypothetical protein